MKLGDLARARGNSIDLSPPLNGCIYVRSAEFREIEGVPTTIRQNLACIRRSTTIHAQKSGDEEMQAETSSEARTGALVVKVIDEKNS